MLDVAHKRAPELGLTLEDMQAFRGAFPWHGTLLTHPELCRPDLWWAQIGSSVEGVYAAHGAGHTLATRLASVVRATYTDPRSYQVLPGADEALLQIRAAGWSNVVLSNHIPELPEIVERLSIGSAIDAVFSSANTGVEKPHPDAFANALASYEPVSDAFMVGDNPIADIEGAARLGIRGVQVGDDVSRTPLDAADIILRAS